MLRRQRRREGACRVGNITEVSAAHPSETNQQQISSPRTLSEVWVGVCGSEQIVWEGLNRGTGGVCAERARSVDRHGICDQEAISSKSRAISSDLGMRGGP